MNARLRPAMTAMMPAKSSRRNAMTEQLGAGASAQPYDAKTLAKKHRIAIEDAKKIIEQYGKDRKASDKAARRIAA
jgi:hypothetical protein